MRDRRRPCGREPPPLADARDRRQALAARDVRGPARCSPSASPTSSARRPATSSPAASPRRVLDAVTLQFLPYPLRGPDRRRSSGWRSLGFGAYRHDPGADRAVPAGRGRRPLVELIYQQRSLARGPRVVAIGGGTGLSTLLRGLKEHTSNLTAIVAVADDGGSSGVLREELGIPPVGDIRRCIAALADAEPLDGRAPRAPLRRARRRTRRRRPAGRSAAIAVGNLLLAAMTAARGRRLRGGRPPGEPRPRGPRPGPAGGRRRR